MWAAVCVMVCEAHLQWPGGHSHDIQTRAAVILLRGTSDGPSPVREISRARPRRAESGSLTTCSLYAEYLLGCSTSGEWCNTYVMRRGIAPLYRL